jgi:uracil-DNA glycosylase
MRSITIMKTDDSDCARSLRSPEAVALHRLMLHEPHIAPLADFVEKLRRAHPAWEFPDFDPLDGGSNADILFLFEKPGRMTSAGGTGSGFISRNNDDPTAEATFGFMKEAGLSRKRTVTWNIVPGWNGTRSVTTAELRAGVDALKGLLPLLPKLRTIILVGQKAQRATSLVKSLGLRILVSAHPSPLVRASQPDVWRAIPSIWAQATA